MCDIKKKQTQKMLMLQQTRHNLTIGCNKKNQSKKRDASKKGYQINGNIRKVSKGFRQCSQENYLGKKIFGERRMKMLRNGEAEEEAVQATPYCLP